MTTVTRCTLIKIPGSIPVLSVSRCLVVSMAINAFKGRRIGRVGVTVTAERPAPRTMMTACAYWEEWRMVKRRWLPCRCRMT